MGARAQIVLYSKDFEAPLTFYTHWGSGQLHNDLARALDLGRSRWNDSEYLARIIFCGMMNEGEEKETTGYGIASGIKSIHGDLDYYLDVDIERQQVVDSSTDETYTFEEFIRQKWGENDYN